MAIENMEKTIKIILFGATGQIGSGVQRACLNHPQIEHVTSVVRRPTGLEHEKLSEVIHGDYLDYSVVEDRLRGFDACFWSIGVSQLQVKTEQEYRTITLDYTCAAADVLVRLNPGMTFCFISGMGTDPTMKSRQMWARFKGETEVKLASYPFKKVYVFRPALVHPTDKNDSRMRYVKILRPLYPLLNALFPKYVVTNEEVGLAMINVVLDQPEQTVFENPEFRKLAGV
ncbi:NAD(P)H-binding protein [Candidatus Latescibacterota bacterium]